MVEVIDKTVPLSTDAFWNAERLEEPTEVERPGGDEDHPDRSKVLNAHFKVEQGEGDELQTLFLTPGEMWQRFRAADGTGRRELARGNGGASG